MPWEILAKGLVVGGLSAFDALGLVLLYRTTRIVNLAQSSMGLIGGILTGMLVQSAGWSFWWALPIGIAVGALVGFGTDRVVLRRLQDAPRAVILVATVGIAQILGSIAVAIPFIFGGVLPSYSIDLGVTLKIGNTLLLGTDLLVLIAIPIAWIGTHWFLNKSRFGLAALALGQESERARALGVPAAAVRGIVWVVAGILASFSGILSIPVLGFNLGGGFGASVLLLALTPAVLAGFRSLNVAVLGALGMGMIYTYSISITERAGDADLILAAGIVLAMGLRRGRFGRAEAAGRATSWEAAATPRPLRAALAASPLVQMAGGGLILLFALAAIFVPTFISPSDTVTYVQMLSYSLAALGVAVAWMFAGEISLGHWGFAIFGAVLTGILPGPWILRIPLAALIVGLLGIPLAYATRGRSVLSFAALSLSAAVVAPFAQIRSGGRVVDAPLTTVAIVAGLLAVFLGAGVTMLRRSRMGASMIAARDDPQRAPWLGASPLRTRSIALFASIALAGLAGSLYMASSSIGLPQASAQGRYSFDVLAWTVMGGLGSPIGVIIGTSAMFIGSKVLPPVYAGFLSGAGILFVVIVAPGGLSRVISRIRDLALRVIDKQPPAQPAPVAAEVAP